MTMTPGPTMSFFGPFRGAKLVLTCGAAVLVLRRDDIPTIPWPGHRDLPGGGRGPGEAPMQCALRELFEETGLKPEKLLSVTMHSFYLVPKASVQLAAVFAAIVAPDDGVSVDDWADALGADETLDPRDPKLVQALAGWSSAIEAARAATKLPYCRFEAANAEEIVPVPRVFPLIGLTHAFALEARVRAANGDVHGALEDVRALFALARHLVGTPVFISVAMAGVTQELGLDTLAHVLAGGNVSVDELAAFPFEPIVLSGELVQRALRLEQAFGFGMIGLAGREGSIRPSDAGPFAGPVGVLYTGLLLEDEVRGYRDVMEEFQAHAKLSVTELAKVVDRESLARRVRSRGVLATLLTPNVDDRLMAFHRFDARTKLARIALRAATVRAQQGAWPTAANFRVDEPNVVLEGDGTFLLLRDTTPGFESAPELRVPPSGKR